MRHDIGVIRDDIAAAACRVAEVDNPVLPHDMPQADRVYLYATPDASRADLATDRLDAALREAAVPVGVDRDLSSATFGVRFTAAFASLGDALRPFTSREAQVSWQAWRRDQDVMAAAVSSAARGAPQAGRRPGVTEKGGRGDER